MTSYKHCISLGWYCGTASSMSKYGLRSCSGPFDWYFSDLESVLKVIETDFSDFMIRDNLYADENDPFVFHDKKYGFTCQHDIINNLDTDYVQIQEKYTRRAKRFMQDIKQPTIFIRAVRSEQEISFIKDNSAYIYNVIRRSNANNEIIFLVLNPMTSLPDNFLWFRLGLSQYQHSLTEMKQMFDSSKQFAEFCKRNILPEDLIMQNKKYEGGHLRVNEQIFSLASHPDANNVAAAVKTFFSDLSCGMYLFGAGACGRILCRYLIDNGVNVKAVIDNNSKKQGSVCEGVPIISLLQIEGDHPNICISISDDQRVGVIQKQIMDQYPDADILTLRQLVYLCERK